MYVFTKISPQQPFRVSLLHKHVCEIIDGRKKYILRLNRNDKEEVRRVRKAEVEGRVLRLLEDREALKKAESLDESYVLGTNLVKDPYLKKFVHDRYKDLSFVEQAFRTMKSAHLGLRPVYVRSRESTIGPCFVVMLAYTVAKYLQKAWSNFDITVQDGLHELSALVTHHLTV